jgi:hypothetical protein
LARSSSVQATLKNKRAAEPDSDDGVRIDADGSRFLCVRLTIYQDVHRPLFDFLSEKRPKRRARLILGELMGINGNPAAAGLGGGSRVVETGTGSLAPTDAGLAPVTTQTDSAAVADPLNGLDDLN